MKNFTITKKSITGRIALGLLMMLSTLAWAQPTVTVPSTVQVVVAGTGGTLGLGGTVGSGGVVVMPDPSTGIGSFTINNPGGLTLTTWSLAGDLSFTQRPTTISQSASATTTTRTIYSYNKALRPSEASNLARSKGRVSIGYSASACGGSMSFDIYKKYSGGNTITTAADYVPDIVGPPCWLAGETYTYSVDQIASDNLQDGIGIDEYYWTVASVDDPLITLTNFYTSADKSSITLQTPSTIEGLWVIKCAYGRANPWDGNTIPAASHTTVVSKTIGALPAEPTYTAAPPTCLPTGTTSFPITATAASINPDFTYTWTIQGASWTISQPSFSSPNITLNGVDNNPGTLILTIEGDCEPSVYTYNINRNFTSAIAISGSTCIGAGSNIFSLPVNAQINNTTWTLPSGWSINPTGSNTPRSIANITVPAGTTAGSYTLVARSTACPSTSISIVVNVRPATPSFVTTGSISPSCVTRNGGPAVTYTVNAVAGATSYQWTFPTGWTPASQTTTSPTITVTPGGSTVSGTVSVVAVGTGGCNSVPATRPVNYTGVTPNSITATCWSIGIAGSTAITVANAPSPFYGTYSVTSSPAGLFTSYGVNPSTGAITLTTSASAAPGTYSLTITHISGGACPSLAATFSVTVAGNSGVFNNPTITGGSFDPSTGGCDTYTIINATAGTTYQWFLNGSATPVVANGTTVFFSPSGNALNLCGSSAAPTSVCVVMTNGTCKTRLCAPLVGTHGAARMANPEAASGSVIEGISIYPNPSQGNFFIKVDGFRESANATLSDTSGKVIGTYELQEGENSIDREGLAAGTYIVILIIDGKKESRQVIIK